MKNIIILLLVVTTLISCNWNGKKSYLIRFDEVEDLTTQTPVYCKGIIVGKITSIKLDKKLKVVVGVDIDRDLTIMSDYQFAIAERDVFGSKVIEIITNEAGKQVNRRDTLSGIMVKKNPIIRIDSIQYEIAKDSAFKVLRN